MIFIFPKMNNYYVGIHYENKIDDVLIKYISSFDEAKEYIHKNKGNKILMFYQLNDISPEEHLSIQKMQWNIQLYSIINNFMPCNLDIISSYLYNIYSCVFATSVLSTLNELNDEHIISKAMMRKLSTSFIAGYMNKFYAKPYAKKIDYRTRSETFADTNYLMMKIPLKFNDFIGLSISVEELRDMAKAKDIKGYSTNSRG